MVGKANSNQCDWHTQNKEAAMQKGPKGLRPPSRGSKGGHGQPKVQFPHGRMQSDPFPKGDVGFWSTRLCCFTRMSSVWGSVHALSRYAFCFSFYFSKVCESASVNLLPVTSPQEAQASRAHRHSGHLFEHPYLY